MASTPVQILALSGHKMRYQGYLASLAAVLASASLVQSLQQRAVDDDTPELRELEDVSPIIPGRYIVEFESVSTYHILKCLYLPSV